MAHAFTLIELMVALLLLALLTGAVGLSFAAPLRRQEKADAIVAIRQFDADARTAAITLGQPMRVIFDLSGNSIARQDESGSVQSVLHLPAAAAITQVDLADEKAFSGQTSLLISSSGWSGPYAVLISGRWVSISGLSGQSTVSDNEPDFSNSPRHDAD